MGIAEMIEDNIRKKLGLSREEWEELWERMPEIKDEFLEMKALMRTMARVLAHVYPDEWKKAAEMTKREMREGR